MEFCSITVSVCGISRPTIGCALHSRWIYTRLAHDVHCIAARCTLEWLWSAPGQLRERLLVVEKIGGCEKGLERDVVVPKQFPRPFLPVDDHEDPLDDGPSIAQGIDGS